MSVKAIDMIILDAHQRYGQKLYIVLSTAIRIAKMNKIKGLELPGDFEYKALVEELEKQSFKYNPSMLLRILEREYNIIETTYKTSNQHWYRFKNIEEVERALNTVIGITLDTEEPDIVMLKIQMKSLQIGYWIKRLKQVYVKDKLSSTDIKIFRKFAFSILPKLVKILRKAEEFEDQLYAEINLAKELINLANIVANRIDIGKNIDGMDEDIVINKKFTSLVY